MSSLPPTPRWAPDEHPEVPTINDNEDFGELVKKLSFYFTDGIELPLTFDELRTSPSGRVLIPLIAYLSDSVHHPAIISALLALKTHFSALEEASDEPGVNQGRGYACEFVAWQFLTNLSERDAIDLLLHELPAASSAPSTPRDAEYATGVRPNGASDGSVNEDAPLLLAQNGRTSSYFGTDSVHASVVAPLHPDEFITQFENLSSLEIAAVSSSKKFLSQKPVQKIINGIWRGDIVFWETLSVNSVKSPKLYSRRRADIFCRLRVPRYLKIFETLFFATFLGLYYAVLVHRNFARVTPVEILLYVWIAGFAYDEFGDWADAGQTSFYASDFWWTWDISIVIVGLVFFALRIAGLATASSNLIDMAYDVLGLEALFLVPRIFSLLSLNPYFGTLIPCLKEMTKDFVKFLSLVVILYLGFLTTFILLARGIFKPREMAWILVKVFFGSSYLGFDVAQEISPWFGPPVMLIFVALTNILLITSLISLLSNSLTKVLDHAREEYLFIYSVYVLEASTSNRLTYYLPPLNLIPLVLRPLRLVLPSERLRSARIVLLRATHLPFVGAIWAYEYFAGQTRNLTAMSIGGPDTPTTPKRLLRSSIHPLRPATAGYPASAEGTATTPGRTHYATRPQTRAGQSESEPQLRAAVVTLAAQVEQLTAIVSKLQQQQQSQQREASMAA
ncbi:hypothetical protein K491DRAFT_244882 [Lophiostoma macrostomum CBS 122681]|uniref:Calcium channel YVC1-like C-terminal transmembrane domain-containing protein n=1 Tax=Lophiostoma macrostomum CBS 122681 TaxID=1314788 RepID=A0A6A6TII6_9PLEO|nr:hypothetical protein K491DRAFT_244882 [Lophiostoma macrostomum CBS 122681]